MFPLPVLLGLLGLGLVLRLPVLTWGLPGPLHLWPYHPDEACIFLCMKNMTPSAFDFNPVDFSWPGLYLYMVMAVLGTLGLAGILPLAPTEAWMAAHPVSLTIAYLAARTLTLASALAGVLLAVRLGEKLAPGRGRIAGALCAVFPVHVILSGVAAPHMLSTVLSAAAVLIATGIPCDPRPRRYVATAVTWGLAVGALYDAYILVVPLFVAHALAPRPLKNLPLFIGTGLLAIATFLLVNPYAVLAPGDFLQSLLIIRQYLELVRPSLRAFFSISLLAFSTPASVAALAGSVHLLVSWGRRFRDERLRLEGAPGVIMVAWFLACGALIAWTGTDFLRRVLSLAIPCAVLAAYALSILRPLPRKLLGALVVVAPLAITLAYLPTLGPGDTRASSRSWIEANLAPGSRIGVVNWLLGPHIDTRRYDCRVLGLDRTKIAEVSYFVATEREIPLATVLQEYPHARVLARFSYAPSILGWSIDESEAPEDWFYPHPRVYVVEVSPENSATDTSTASR